MMKLIISCLIVSLWLILPSPGLAQSPSRSNQERKPKDYAAIEYFGVPLKVTLTSGEITRGRLIGWQGDATAGIMKNGNLIIRISQTDVSYLELEFNKITRKILLSEVTEITVVKEKGQRNFFQKVGHGFRKAGYILLGISYTAIIYVVIIIDGIIHGGKIKWDYP